MRKWLRRVLLGGTPAVLGMMAMPRASTAQAPVNPVAREVFNIKGDIAVIGNTLAFDCEGSNATRNARLVANQGTSQACQDPGALDVLDVTGIRPRNNDSGADQFWSVTDNNVAATAAPANGAAVARSVAKLTIPADAVVVHARLYWAANVTTNQADADVNLRRPNGNEASFASDRSSTVAAGDGTFWYQSSANVTDFVKDGGTGLYRVSGVSARTPFNYVESEATFAAWSLVVVYGVTTPGAPKRNIRLFDGLRIVNSASQVAEGTIAGFTVPNAGYDGKLAVIAYEGDANLSGDQLLFGKDTASLSPLSTGAGGTQYNPPNNFFNSSSTILNVPVGETADGQQNRPAMTGRPDSMGKFDLDIVDITDKLVPGQDAAVFRAITTQDQVAVGAFVTSISSFEPDLSTSTKAATPPGPKKIGDTVTYTITVQNTGSDAAVNTVVEDDLPAQVTYKPGTLKVDDAPRSDGADADGAEFDGANKRVKVTIPNIAIGGSTRITFDVVIAASGTVLNQARITTTGALGALVPATVTDGNGTGDGSPPTPIDVLGCATNAQCDPDGNGPGVGFCNTLNAPDPAICVECRNGLDCGFEAARPICDANPKGLPGKCIGCRGDGECVTKFGTTSPACQTVETAVKGECTECSANNGLNCNRNPRGPLCVTERGRCGCRNDSDCGTVTSGLVCQASASGVKTCQAGCRPTENASAGETNGCPGGQQCFDPAGGNAGTCDFGPCAASADGGVGVCPSGSICDATVNRCVGCTSDTDCRDGKICDLAIKTCVECSDSQPGGTSKCSPDQKGDECLPRSTDTGVSLECGCVNDGDCGLGKVCDATSKVCVDGCNPAQVTVAPGSAGGGTCPPPSTCVANTSGGGTCVPPDGGADGGGNGPGASDPSAGVIEGGGCSCTTTGAKSSSPLAFVGFLCAIAIYLSRRKNTRRVTRTRRERSR